MTLAYYCVFFAALLPYLCVAVAKSTPEYIKGGNRAPREYAEQLEGARKRAYWAQQNAFEAFPIFAAIVVIAGLVDRAGLGIDRLALAFIVCRVLHAVFYVANQSTLRSVAWAGGAFCEVAMIGLITT